MRVLLLLGIVGAAIYAVLFFSYDALTDGKTENTYAGQTQPDHPDAKRALVHGTGTFRPRL